MVHAARAFVCPRNLAEETEARSWGVRGPTNVRYRWILLKNSISARHRTKSKNPLFRSASDQRSRPGQGGSTLKNVAERHRKEFFNRIAAKQALTKPAPTAAMDPGCVKTG